ncbi:hypothetical protein CYY_001688 [Polysphondylium violaceum]|uniref:Autophagy-related protein 27 n=1 Tax=Polysphondylium violaceum TaxID=133409 RepID=A0A8J4VAB8_9MYCE|nr:hypothetical protein CYY_001688 [Polysphondylium violaceum]
MKISYFSLALIVIVFLINSSFCATYAGKSSSEQSSSGSASSDPAGCVYTVNHKKLNISSIPTLTFVDKVNNTGYTLSVCAPLGPKQPCGQMSSDVFSCITKNYNATKSNLNGGSAPEALETVKGYDLSVKYAGGASCNMIKIYSTVNFQCGKTNAISSVTAGAWRAIGGEGCFGQYVYVVDSPLFCAPKSGLTGGDIFLIIFFCTFGAYFIFGAIFLAIRGNRGADLIPNRGFWASFGSLIKDGACFIKNKITGKSNTTYQQI